MSLSKEQRAFTKDIALLIQEADRLGIELTFEEAHRTKNQQYLYVYGKKIELESGELKLAPAKPRSKTMYSKHLDRLAVDFNFFIDGEPTYDKKDIQVLGDFWESLDPKNRWGGNFKNFTDTPHFERSAA